MDVAALAHLDLDLVGQRVDHGDADAVQATGDRVAAAAELATGVQLGEHDLDRRLALAGHDVGRDAAAVVDHPDPAVGLEGDLDVVGVAGQRLVDGVVHDLPDQVVQAALAGRADVHAGALADRLEPLEHGDRAGVVGRGRDLGGKLGDRVGPGSRQPGRRGGSRGCQCSRDRPRTQCSLGRQARNRTHRTQEDTGSGRTGQTHQQEPPSWFHVEQPLGLRPEGPPNLRQSTCPPSSNIAQEGPQRHFPAKSGPVPSPPTRPGSPAALVRRHRRRGPRRRRCVGGPDPEAPVSRRCRAGRGPGPGASRGSSSARRGR